MQPMFTVHQPAAVPQAHIPTTHRSFVAPMMPSQPDSEAYGCDTPCVVPGVTMPQEECFVGDISTLLPAFGTSLTGTPLPHYAHQAPVPQPYVVAASPPFDAGPSSFTPASDEPRRLSHPARSGLSVQSPIAHPYARLWNKKARSGRRKKWTHALEKLLFTSREIATMGSPHRRTIYHASLEAHIDQLHEQLFSYSLEPVPLEDLSQYRGLNNQIARSMVAGLQRDAEEIEAMLLELERANNELEQTLSQL